MKKICFTFLVSVFCLSLQAQEIWLEASLKGGVGMSFLTNKNIFDDNNYDYLLTSMYAFGGKFAVNFGANHGLLVEALYGQAGQDFEYQPAGIGANVENQISWKSWDAYLLYRHTSRSVYVELGPMYSLVNSVEQTDNEINLEAVDNAYEDSYVAGVFGFGGLVASAETFSVGLGIRLHYGFTDFVSDEGRKANFPNPTVVYPNEESTNPVGAQVLVEFNFGLGHFAKTGCGQRMKFMRGRGR